MVIKDEIEFQPYASIETVHRGFKVVSSRVKGGIYMRLSIFLQLYIFTFSSNFWLLESVSNSLETGP